MPRMRVLPDGIDFAARECPAEEFGLAATWT